MSRVWTESDLQGELEACPAIRFLQISVVSLDVASNEVVLKLPLRPELERSPASRQFHGGPIASFVDTAGDYAIALAVGGGVPTINFRIDYLRPAIGDYLVARASARRVGRTIAVSDVDVFDEREKLCAIGRGSYLAVAG